LTTSQVRARAVPPRLTTCAAPGRLCRDRTVVARLASIPMALDELIDARVDAVIDAVVDTLVSDGYEAVQVHTVARRARTSLRTIYEHFAGRDELIVAAMERWMASNAYAHVRMPEAGESPHETLGRVTDRRVSLAATGGLAHARHPLRHRAFHRPRQRRSDRAADEPCGLRRHRAAGAARSGRPAVWQLARRRPRGTREGRLLTRTPRRRLSAIFPPYAPPNGCQCTPDGVL
jgi:AcrR family transcriptional regulator